METSSSTITLLQAQIPPPSRPTFLFFTISSGFTFGTQSDASSRLTPDGASTSRSTSMFTPTTWSRAPDYENTVARFPKDSRPRRGHGLWLDPSRLIPRNILISGYCRWGPLLPTRASSWFKLRTIIHFPTSSSRILTPMIARAHPCARHRNFKNGAIMLLIHCSDIMIRIILLHPREYSLIFLF